MALITIATKYGTAPRNTWTGVEKIPLDVSGADGVGLASTLSAYILTTPTLTGHPTIEGVTATGATGTGKLVFDTSPTLVTPNLGTPSAAVLTNATGIVSAIEFVIDGGGVALTTGIKGYLEVPVACTIQRATLLADVSGSVVVDIFSCTYANFAPPTHPASADKITASAPPTITTALKSQDSTLTGWTTAIPAGNILGFNVNCYDDHSRNYLTQGRHLMQMILLGQSHVFSAGGNFPAGNQTAADLKAFGASIASYSDPDTAPTAGGTLTINSASLGSYDYTIFASNQTVSSFVNSAWFTATADSRCAVIVVKGNLTINAGQVFVPSNRKLFTLVYVTGALAINGEMSMTARGANHSATGSNIAAAAIKIATGTFGGVTDPNVPAAGGVGGLAVVTAGSGLPGANGTSGGSGGGGSGGVVSTGTTGAGAQGTSFSGGPGGGGAANGGISTDGGANGGAGGDGNGAGGIEGGAGNPGGTGVGQNGPDGTGGTLVIIALGALSGSGVVTGGGVGSTYAAVQGGGSGGGSVTVIAPSDTSSITPTATGGQKTGGGINGGNGGDGTARKLIA